MPTPKPTYNAQCYTLAAFVTDGEPFWADDARTEALATLIQSAIEDWLAYERDNYEPPTGAIQDEPDFPGYADNH